MTDPDPLEQLLTDPAIQEAHQEFEDSCDVSEDECWACQSKKAIFWLSNMDLDDSTELVTMLADDLESSLSLIAACQRGINFLSGLALEATSFIHYHELQEDDEDE